MKPKAKKKATRRQRPWPAEFYMRSTYVESYDDEGMIVRWWEYKGKKPVNRMKKFKYPPLMKDFMRRVKRDARDQVRRDIEEAAGLFKELTGLP